MSEQERELDVPEEVSGSILFCQTQLTYVQFSGELPLSDLFWKKLEFCPKWGGGGGGAFVFPTIGQHFQKYYMPLICGDISSINSKMGGSPFF